MNDGSKNVVDGAERIRRRADARRDEILRAAARIFRRHGYAAAGMREIAAEAGLSPGNLYHYFAGKDEILFYCQDRTLNRLLESLEQARLSGGTAADRVRRLVRDHVETLIDAVEGGSAHLEMHALPGERRAAMLAKRDRYEAGIRSMLEDGMRSGELIEDDPALVARAILGAANWPALWFRPDGPESATEVASGLADYLTRGIEPVASRRPRPSSPDAREDRKP